jgi:hypothetical protein
MQMMSGPQKRSGIGSFCSGHAWQIMWLAPSRRAHVLVEGSLVSSIYQPNGKGKKSKATKITSWSIRADVVRKLDRNEQEPEAPATVQATESDEAPF